MESFRDYLPNYAAVELHTFLTKDLMEGVMVDGDVTHDPEAIDVALCGTNDHVILFYWSRGS